MPKRRKLKPKGKNATNVKIPRMPPPKSGYAPARGDSNRPPAQPIAGRPASYT